MTEFSLRQKVGVLGLDLPRFIGTVGLSAVPGFRRRWVNFRNREESIGIVAGQKGVCCDWRWTSDLHAPKVFPWLGQRLFVRAIADWPIEFAEAPPNQTGDFDLSFIVGHRGAARVPHLLATLRSLFAQRGARCECIVVEQDCEPIVAPSLPPGTRHVFSRIPEPEMPYSRSWAFNVGAREARGRVLVFHDNDIVAPREYAAELVRLFRGGFEAMRLSRFLFHLAEASSPRPGEQFRLGERPGIESVMQNAEGGTIAVSRDAFFRVGGFDEGFVGWGGEDNEFFDRLKAVRLHGASYLPFLHLWHPFAVGKWGQHANTGYFESRMKMTREDRIRELGGRKFGYRDGQTNQSHASLS